MQDAKTLILDYLEDNLPAEDVAKLEQWISEDIANARLYLRLAADERAISKLLNQDEVGSLVLDLSHQDEPESDLLPELLKLEAAAQPLSHDVLDFGGGIEPAERSADAYRSTLTTLGDTGFWGYLAKSALRSKPARWAGAAAVLILAATLFFVFVGNNDAPTPPLAFDGPIGDSQTETPAPALQPIVATLTAEHKAVWDRRPGQDLYAGQRFTLTEGFAELTTGAGAVAVLEAPATIELLDNNNAIRLQTGKLVGICETDSSKGFTVRTPHMDITDLGTRFGVDVATDTTDVHVYQGRVEVSPAGRDGSPSTKSRIVEAGHALRAEQGGQALVSIEPAFDRFAKGLGSYSLLGTGAGLADGQVDLGWQIIAIQGAVGLSELQEPWPLAVSQSKRKRWEAGRSLGPVPSQWIVHQDDLEKVANRALTYTIQTELLIPPSVDLDRSSLAMQYAADNMLMAVRINGRNAYSRTQGKPVAPNGMTKSLRELGL